LSNRVEDNSELFIVFAFEFIQTAYLSASGERIPDQVNLLYSDAPLALSTDFAVVAAYVRELKSAAMEALSEETVLISVEQVYHAV
jgi:hypothetical protein